LKRLQNISVAFSVRWILGYQNSVKLAFGAC